MALTMIETLTRWPGPQEEAEDLDDDDTVDAELEGMLEEAADYEDPEDEDPPPSLEEEEAAQGAWEEDPEGNSDGGVEEEL